MIKNEYGGVRNKRSHWVATGVARFIATRLFSIWLPQVRCVQHSTLVTEACHAFTRTTFAKVSAELLFATHLNIYFIDSFNKSEIQLDTSLNF